MDAEVVTVSHGHDNHSYTQVVRDGAYEIHGPGEYEIAGVSVIGVPTYHDAEKGAKQGRNTVYVIEIDDVRVCHLGDLGHKLDDVEAEAVASPDVLLVPVGGHTAMNAAQAAEVVRQLEPRYVVDRKSTRLNSSHPFPYTALFRSRAPSKAATRST